MSCLFVCSTKGTNDLIEKRKSSTNSNNTSFESVNQLKSVPSGGGGAGLMVAAAAGSSNTASSANSSSSLLKRKRKNRTAFTANQIFELEKRFSNQRYLSPHDRDRIAHELSLSTAQVITWFQNRRAKQKRDIEELKNDVNAAKSLRVLDPEIDVEKMLKSDKSLIITGAGSKYNQHAHSNYHGSHLAGQKVTAASVDYGSYNDIDNDDETDENDINDDDDDHDDDEIDIDNDSCMSSSEANNDLNNSGGGGGDNSIASSRVNSND
jgi:hypothetical protein